jgi:hypothetical protein
MLLQTSFGGESVKGEKQWNDMFKSEEVRGWEEVGAKTF